MGVLGALVTADGERVEQTVRGGCRLSVPLGGELEGGAQVLAGAIRLVAVEADGAHVKEGEATAPVLQPAGTLPQPTRLQLGLLHRRATRAGSRETGRPSSNTKNRRKRV